jgi:MraZ protein
MISDPMASAPQDFPFTFHGSYTRAVDAKGRFNLPFRLRRAGQMPEDEKYVVTMGADGALALFPYAVWIENFNRMRRGEPGATLRENLRRMSRASHVVVPDAQGRVAIPADFLKSRGIGQKVTVLGVGSYMELWDPQVLEQSAGQDDLDDGFVDGFYR